MVLGLVSPLPPQMGGVVSVADWLLRHQEEIGCRYEVFDLFRPAEDEMGGKLRASSIPRQIRLLARFVRWLPSSPRVVHACVSCSPIGLARDLLYLALLRLAGRTAVAHIHGSQLDLVEGSRLRSLSLRLVGRLTAERVAVAPWAVSMLARVGVSSRCILNPIRIEPEQVNGTPPSSPGLRLLFVGYYGERKGCPELVRALARAREAGVDASLQFVGREERRGEERLLKELVRQHALEDVVDFPGFVPAEQLEHYYLTSDVICLPSAREILPMALLEGMAFELPALATPVGGITELVVDGETGVLVTPGRIDELATAIVDLAADPERRRRMGKAARARVLERAGSERLSAQWRTLYRELGAPAPHARPTRRRAREQRPLRA